jgi:hypothetical protein
MTITHRRLFDSMGVDAVRTDLQRAFAGNQRIPAGPGRHQALEWLSEQERRQRRRETLRHSGHGQQKSIAEAFLLGR